MKRIISLTSMTLLFGLGLSTTTLSQQPSDAEKAKMAAVYAELAKPGAEHKQLETLAGNWDMEVKYWMQPDKPPMTVKGACQNRMVLGGRFLVSEAKSGEGGPMALENLIIIGFDRRHKKYTTVALDSMGTYWVAASGPYDESRKAIVMYGEDVDPILRHTQRYDMVTRIINPNQYVMEIIFKDSAHTGGGKDRKLVEVTHTRK